MSRIQKSLLLDLINRFKIFEYKCFYIVFTHDTRHHLINRLDVIVLLLLLSILIMIVNIPLMQRLDLDMYIFLISMSCLPFCIECIRQKHLLCDLYLLQYYDENSPIRAYAGSDENLLLVAYSILHSPSLDTFSESIRSVSMHRSLPLDYTTLEKKEKEKNNKEIDNGALFQLTKTKLTIFFFFYPFILQTWKRPQRTTRSLCSV